MEQPFKNQLAAHDLRLRHCGVHLASEQLRRPLPSRGQVHLLGVGEVLLRDVGQQDGVLRFLPLLNAQLRPCLHIRGKAQGPALVSGEAGHQLAVGEHLPGIQHPGLQKLRLRLRQQGRAVRQAAAVGLCSEGHGKFQGADAPLPLRGVQHCHPHGAGDRPPAVPEFPAVKEHLARGLDDPRDGLRRLLLGQRHLSARLIGVEAGLFQFQFHGSPFLSRPLSSGDRRLKTAPGAEELSRPRVPPQVPAESRSADTVCPAGTGYSGILNSFRRMPLRAFGDFHTTIRIVTDSFLTPAAGAAARDQQERHQKHQQPRRENGRDQDASPQRRRADAQQGASAASSKHTSHAPFSLPVYTSLREWCGTSIRN